MPDAAPARLIPYRRYGMPPGEGAAKQQEKTALQKNNKTAEIKNGNIVHDGGFPGGERTSPQVNEMQGCIYD